MSVTDEDRDAPELHFATEDDPKALDEIAKIMLELLLTPQPASTA